MGNFSLSRYFFMLAIEPYIYIYRIYSTYDSSFNPYFSRGSRAERSPASELRRVKCFLAQATPKQRQETAQIEHQLAHLCMWSLVFKIICVSPSPSSCSHLLSHSEYSPFPLQPQTWCSTSHIEDWDNPLPIQPPRVINETVLGKEFLNTISLVWRSVLIDVAATNAVTICEPRAREGEFVCMLENNARDK